MKMVQFPVDLARESVIIGAEAAALAEKVAADHTAIENKAPLVADALIQNGVVDEIHKQATVDMLRNPVATLDIVARMAKMASKPHSMGASTTEKTAAGEHDPQFPPQKESDRIFEETLGAVTP